MSGNPATRAFAIGNGVIVCAWTLPWAALAVALFDPWLAPWLFNLSGPFAFFLPLVYIPASALGAVVVLVRGLCFIRGQTRLSAYVLLVCAGVALDWAVAWRGHWFNYVPYYAGHPRWSVLAAGAGYVLLAVMLATLPTGSPRSALAVVRASLRATWRQAERRDLTVCATAAIVAVIAGVLLIWPWPAAQVMRVPEDATEVTVVAFSRNGADLAVADDANDVSVSAVPSGRRLLAASGDAVSFAFSPSGGVVAVGVGGVRGEHGGATQVWSTASGRRIFSVRDPGAYVDTVAFSPDGTVVASGDSTGTVALIDAATGHELVRLSGGSSTVDSLAFSPDGTEIAGATYAGTVTLWSTATGHVIAATALPGVTPSVWANAPRPIAVSFVRGGGTLAIGDARSGLYQWTTSTGSLVRRIAWACSGMSCDNAIAFSRDGSSVAVTGQGAGGRAAEVWNTATGTLVAKVSDPADYKVVSAAFSANGAELAIGDFDGGPDDVQSPGMGEGLTFTPSAYVYKIP